MCLLLLDISWRGKREGEGGRGSGLQGGGEEAVESRWGISAFLTLPKSVAWASASMERDTGLGGRGPDDTRGFPTHSARIGGGRSAPRGPAGS